MSDVLSNLDDVLQRRKNAPAKHSYVAALYAGGVDNMLKKIGEEAAELMLAVKNDDQQQIVHEAADLWFHTLVALAHAGLHSTDILQELERRFGVSGHAEKAARK